MAKDELEEAAGKSVTITLGGKEYEVSQFKVGDLLALKSHIRSRRIMDFRAAADNMESTERSRILVSLASQTISELELIEEASTPDGLFFLLWRVLRRSDAKLTLDALTEMIDKETLDDLTTIMQSMNPEEDPTENPPPAGTG